MGCNVSIDNVGGNSKTDKHSPKRRSRKSVDALKDVQHSVATTVTTRPKSEDLSSPNASRRRLKNHEDEIELIFKSKRANVYTAGVSLDNRINYKPKNIMKTKAQNTLISKYTLFYSLTDSIYVFYTANPLISGMIVFICTFTENQYLESLHFTILVSFVAFT